MHIALINHYAGSLSHGMEYRPYYMAREWIERGHSVSILAASFSHVRRRNPATGATQEKVDGIDYQWIPASPYAGNGLKRFVNVVQFVTRLHQAAPAFARSLEPNVVIASSTYPLDIIPALRLSRLAKARLIFEIHDLWPLSPMEIGGMPRWHPFIMLMSWAERRALRHADRVVSMLPYAKSYLMSRGMAAEKFSYIPNGFWPSDWSDSTELIEEPVCSKISGLRKRFPFLIVYTGSHGAANALEHFVKSAVYLHEHGIGLVLVGQGPEKVSLMEMARAQRSENILFLDPVPKGKIPALLRKFDGAYLGWRALSLYRHGVSPNKLFDYMMAERPVIHGINAENDMVKEAGCGITVPAENAKALAEACIELKLMPECERIRKGQRGREYARGNHDYGLLARRFEQVMKPR